MTRLFLDMSRATNRTSVPNVSPDSVSLSSSFRETFSTTRCRSPANRSDANPERELFCRWSSRRSRDPLKRSDGSAARLLLESFRVLSPGRPSRAESSTAEMMFPETSRFSNFLSRPNDSLCKNHTNIYEDDPAVA